ncbi:MAG TPA: D-2-hydroxyacid dehydrogenase [Candidatus Binatia bacterium]|nr:D-2-hydroxyacid dehydrogenase [Candidatus Binatia bacterium]
MTEVLVTAPFPERLIEKIKSVSPRIELSQINVANKTWPEDKTTTAEVLYAISDVPPVELAPNLRWVQAHWAGVDQLRDHSIWESDVVITTASGIHAPNIAQYVMAQMLAWANRVPKWLHYQAQSRWPENRWEKFVPEELRGKTLGIAGYGSIGREMARVAKVFGMNVLATKRDARRLKDVNYMISDTGDPTGELPARIYPGEATRSMVSECDFVVVTLPLTDKTYHFFNEEIFRAMPSNAYLINVGRGAVVDESDLVRALKKGWIAGAGLDVFENEPLPTDSPLWQLDNVIISPHVSGFTPNYDDRATDLFVENLRRYLSGKPLLNVVSREHGY